jgi:hypothetical protein
MNHWVIAALFLAWLAVLLVSLRVFASAHRTDRRLRKAFAEYRIARGQKL